MTTALDLLLAVEDLRANATRCIEESFRLTVEGKSLDTAVKQSIVSVVDTARRLGTPVPSLMISDEYADPSSLSTSDYDDEPWRLIIGKAPIVDLMPARKDEKRLLFFTVEGFHHWLSTFDPFAYPVGYVPDLAEPTTIRVNGLTAGFGGPLLWVLPPNAPDVEVQTIRLPDVSDVHSLIHTNSAKPIRVCPAGYALTWGDLDSPQAAPVIGVSARVLAACLVQELKQMEDGFEVTLQGTKRLSLRLYDETQAVTSETLKKLVETVGWVYDVRPETRLRLVMDRLSIDIEPGQSMLSGIEKYLGAALQQAVDSYGFVILERKDAYHKELRELMKDMKSQADLYAAKVRDLLHALTRDVLGMLVFIGFSFIGKFDRENLHLLLESAELALLVKVLAGYLVLSFTLQISAHLWDANLAYQESAKWLDVLQHYSSQADKEDRFLGPIRKRRRVLFLAMGIAGFIYSLLVLVTWNLPCLAEGLLAP